MSLDSDFFEIDSQILDPGQVELAKRKLSDHRESLLKSFSGVPSNVNEAIRRLTLYFFGKVVRPGVAIDRNNLRGRLVTNVLLKGNGSCFELSFLYLILANSLKIPVYLILFPMHHMLIGYRNDRGEKYVVELMKDGAIKEEEDHLKWLSKSYKVRHIAELSERDCSSVYCNLIGHLYYKKSDMKTAERYLKMACELSPNLPRVHYAMGYYLMKEKHDYDSAIAEFEEETRIDPHFFHSQLYLAYLYSLKNEGAEKVKERLGDVVKIVEAGGV